MDTKKNYIRESIDEEYRPQKPNNKKGVKLLPIKAKISIINYAKETNCKTASMKFNVPYTTLKDWMKNEQKFLNIDSNKLNKTTLHAGRKIKNPEIEPKLIEFIEFNRKLLNPINIWSLLLKMYSIDIERKNFTTHANRNFIYKILRRDNYTFKAKGHLSAPLPKSCYEQTSIFLNDCWNKRRNNGYWNAIIGNMEETPIAFNMEPNSTVIKKGSKLIYIKTQDPEKCRLKVLLTVTADGGKLPPLIIFKAKPNGNVERELNKDINVQKKRCYIGCSFNASSTSEIMKKWYNEIWKQYLLSDYNFNEEGLGLLILDKTTSQFCDELNKNSNIEIAYIPRGMGRYLQPIEACINEPFKSALREKYALYFINNQFQEFKISRTKMIEIICDVWYDDKIITKDLVYKSFRSTGIANNLDRSEDGMFTVWRKMGEDTALIDNDLEDDCDNTEDQEIMDDDDDEDEDQKFL